MIFRELILQNFGPYLGKNIIKLKDNQENNPAPIILFGGMNGGGKTTLIDAIRLTLYGKRAKCSTRGNLSYNDFLLQCINNKNLGETTRVELEFEHIINDELQVFRIVRHWDKNTKDGNDNLGVLKQEYKDEFLVNTWDEYIENILPLGISNLFLFDGEQVKELADQDIPTLSIIKAIKSLLGLELAERLDEDLDILTSRKRKEFTKLEKLNNLQEIDEKLSSLQQQESELNKKNKMLQKAVEIAQVNETKMWQKFQVEGGKIASEKSILQIEIKNIEEKIVKEKDDIRKLVSRSLPLAMIKPLLQEARSQGEREIKSAQAVIAKKVIQERDERLLSHVAKLSLTSEDIESIKDFLKDENKSLEDDITEINNSWLNISSEEIKQIDTILEYQLPLQINQAHTHQNNLKELDLDLENKERQLKVVPSPEVYQALNMALDEAKEYLIQVKFEKQQNDKKLKDLQSQIQITTKELNSYTEEVLKRKNSEHILQSITKVKNTLTEFRNRLTLNKLNKLEVEITECFRYLLHKSNLVNRVIIDSNSFSLSLYDNEGKLIPKNRLSAGEKQLLAISFLWGLARVSGRNLPIAIDTPLGRLDSSHRNNLVERYFPSASHQVILLSTDTEIDEKQIKLLRKNEAIALEYLLKYNSKQQQTTVTSGYFW